MKWSLVDQPIYPLIWDTGLPIDLVLGVPDPETQQQKYGSEFANELASKLQIIHNNARNQL